MMHGPDPIEQETVYGLLKALEPVFELHRNIPARCIQALLLVAYREGGSVQDYAKWARMSPSTMSRNLLDIGQRNRHMEPGLGLVEARRKADNLRENEYSLSHKGQALVRKMLKRLT